jgi:hypothetical protein
VNTWHRIKAGGYNGYLTITIDGQEVFNVLDNTFTSGLAGLYCWENQSSFWDNLSIECAVNDSTVLEDITISDGQSECYEATQVIIVGGNGSTFVVQSGGVANLIAGQKIDMLPGASALSGSNLLARISSNGFYCSSPHARIAINGEELVAEKTAFPLMEIRSPLIVYPNPTTGNFTVESNGEIQHEPVHIEVYGIRGEKVLSQVHNGAMKHEFSLAQQPPGLYFIHILTGTKSETLKIIKQ